MAKFTKFLIFINEANNTFLFGRWESDFKLTILTSWTKFAPKRVFPVKNKKSEHHHWILHVRISLGTKVQLKLIILDQIWGKRAFPVVNKKSEQHHRIQHIRITLRIKCHLKLTNLTFSTKFTQREHFQSQTKKVNTTIKFWIFELV